MLFSFATLNVWAVICAENALQKGVADGRDDSRCDDPESDDARELKIDAAHELDEALRPMAKHQLRRLPVVEKDGKLIGIVARADVAKHATPRQTGEVVEKISN